jgi:hypothetical protein
MFFIGFKDYLRFFYLTSICKYVKANDHSVCEDEHPSMKYCCQKFTIPKDYNTPIICTLNQIHSRFVEHEKGTYLYAPLKIILAKFVKEREVDPLSKTPDQDVLAFVDGDLIDSFP